MFTFKVSILLIAAAACCLPLASVASARVLAHHYNPQSQDDEALDQALDRNSSSGARNLDSSEEARNLVEPAGSSKGDHADGKQTSSDERQMSRATGEIKDNSQQSDLATKKQSESRTSGSEGDHSSPLMSKLNEILALAKRKDDDLRNEQQLVEKKVSANPDGAWKNELKSADQLKKTEDLVRYIVSLVVPDVLKTLASNKKNKIKGARSGDLEHEHEVPLEAVKAEIQQAVPSPYVEKPQSKHVLLGERLRRKPLKGKLVGHSLEFEASPEDESPGQKGSSKPLTGGKLAPFKKLKLAESKRRQGQKSAVDPNTLNLAMELLQKLGKKDGETGKSAGQSKPGYSSNLKVRKTHKQETRKSESKKISNQVTNDALDLEGENDAANSELLHLLNSRSLEKRQQVEQQQQTSVAPSKPSSD